MQYVISTLSLLLPKQKRLLFNKPCSRISQFRRNCSTRQVKPQWCISLLRNSVWNGSCRLIWFLELGVDHKEYEESETCCDENYPSRREGTA
jgi:hypothetical protein